jgi:hypothetical protein
MTASRPYDAARAFGTGTAKQVLLRAVLVLAATVRVAIAAPPCATGDSACGESVERYRLTASGTHWDVAGEDRVVEDLLPRYRAFFDVILDPADARDPDLRALRDHLEQPDADRRNFDALNAVSIAYFELNFRAESDRGGDRYFADSFRAARLLALPWRAYSEARDPRLRDAILDFFEDAATGEKLMARNTAGRIAPIVESLERKESDPARRKRIRKLTERARLR